MTADFVPHAPEGSVARAIPHGWLHDGQMEYSQRPITRCATDICRAWVSDVERRQQHDREFHLLLVGGPDADHSLPLTIDGVRAGQAREVPTGWHVHLDARGALFESVDITQDTLNGALAEAARIHPLAKWYAEGLHASSWKPVRP